MTGPAAAHVHETGSSSLAAVHRAIHSRRDLRGQFTNRPIDDATLLRLLTAAHHAPSVGLSRAWNFTVIRSDAIKRPAQAAYRKANDEARAMFPEQRPALFSSLKLKGIRTAPVSLYGTRDHKRGGPVVLGRTHQPQMDVYSTDCAVQNLLLATRAEGIGAGWVSIFHPGDMQQMLGLPDPVSVVAWLCLRPGDALHDQPELQAKGWTDRRPLADLVLADRRGQGSFQAFLPVVCGTIVRKHAFLHDKRAKAENALPAGLATIASLQRFAKTRRQGAASAWRVCPSSSSRKTMTAPCGLSTG